jgi:hypothetical protein
VLVVGAGELGEFGVWLVRKGDLTRAFQIVGIIDDDPKKQGMRIDGIKVIGTTRNVDSLVTQHDIGVIFFAISNIKASERERIISTLEKTTAKLVLIPNMVEMMRAYFTPDIDANSQFWDPGDPLTIRMLDAWLVEVERLLSRGDIDAAREQIHALRSHYHKSSEYAEIYDRVLAE